MLDGIGSAGTIVQYRFDFGDGAPVEVTSSPRTEHTYSTVGSIDACLTVVSDAGRESGAACHRISVQEAEMPDAQVPDAGVDASVDAAIDAAVDAHPDAAIDAAVDRPPEVMYLESALAAGCVSVPANAQTLPPLGDDAGDSVNLPFSFPFFGVPQSSVGVSSNGYLQFPGGGQLTVSQNRAIPDPATPNGIVAVLWDDLAPPGADGSAPVRTFPAMRGTVPGLVVHWESWTFFGAPTQSQLTFQAALWRDGVIDIHYCTLSDSTTPGRASGGSATVGVENATGTAGTQHSFNQVGSISTSAGIRFTPQ